MRQFCYIILLCCVVEISFGQNLYDTAHTKVFAEYLYNTRQYKFAAQEYSRLADSTFSFNLDYSLKAVECYVFDYDYKNALLLFENRVLPSINNHPNLFFDYVKLLVRNQRYNLAYNYCDSVKPPNMIKSYNIKYCLGVITDLQFSYNSEMLMPEVIILTESVVKQKKMFPAVAMSSVLPGTGRIYCGYVSEGVTSLLRSCFDYLHVAYGFHKYGFGDPYPIFFAAVSACFYVGNIFGTVKSVKKYNSTHKRLRDEKIIDFMYGNLF